MCRAKKKKTGAHSLKSDNSIEMNEGSKTGIQANNDFKKSFFKKGCTGT
jgi:hypothetical protein